MAYAMSSVLVFSLELAAHPQISAARVPAKVKLGGRLANDLLSSKRRVTLLIRFINASAEFIYTFKAILSGTTPPPSSKYCQDI